MVPVFKKEAVNFIHLLKKKNTYCFI